MQKLELKLEEDKRLDSNPWPQRGNHNSPRVYLQVHDLGDAFLSLFLRVLSLLHLDNVLLTFHDVLVQVVHVGLQVFDLEKETALKSPEYGNILTMLR